MQAKIKLKATMEDEPQNAWWHKQIQGHTSPKIPTGHASAAAPMSPLRNVKPMKPYKNK